MALGLQALVTYGVNYALGVAFSPLSRTWMVLCQGALAGLAGGAVFVLITIGLHVPESKLIIKLKETLLAKLRVRV